MALSKCKLSVAQPAEHLGFKIGRVQLPFVSFTNAEWWLAKIPFKSIGGGQLI
jgi:hypothetical protein